MNGTKILEPDRVNLMQQDSTAKRKCSGQPEKDFYDYKAAVSAYQNYMEGFQLVLSQKEHEMTEICQRRLIPLWFQELSNEQVEALNQLLEAVQDDLDEDTFFRCRSLVRRLGVYPICPEVTFREALIMSRGNDLCFLWFLLELFYSKGRKDYSNNERLLMSAICHLDMMSTLRGLEAVLPPPAPKKPCCKRYSGSKGGLSDWASNVRYCSPYLERQRVTCRKPESFPICEFIPSTPFCISRYEKYRDPDYIIPNEASRWFARKARGNQTSFDEMDEQVQRTIPLSSACDSAELIVRELLNDQIALMVSQTTERADLCRKHQDMEKRRKKLMGLLTKRTAVREKINDDVARIREETRYAKQVARETRMIQLLLRKIIDDSIVSAMLTPRNNCPECWESFERQRKLQQGTTRCSCTSDRGVFCLRSMLSVNQTTAQKFFRLCCGTVPYEFDYRKILEEDGTPKPGCPVKKAIRVALGMEEGDTDEGQAIDRCLKDMWRCELKLWNERFLKGREQAREKTTEVDMLDFEFIASKDPLFLELLLKRALFKLCEDPKYVLATFPETYKLPFLNSWIQHRYGVQTSRKERNELLHESKFFWDWLIPKVTALRWPGCKDVGMQGRVNWNYKQRLENTVHKQLAKFYRKFKDVQIHEGRFYWSTMAPYQINVDRFRQIYFDYLPNCEPLIGPMVRPWHPFEYRLSRAVLAGSESKTRC
ncbi:uncharacterized protein LOC131689384 [Topomyia yanbarensis]|uniref:uncharacterized protein LOC131689384 n=1 Tax=Topomyia yanbarensis TaxID=2498891 RepID=UPI00273ACF49|nr:uncharacterized protein LOC131689384 [Topomyia yanbarensis]